MSRWQAGLLGLWRVWRLNQGKDVGPTPVVGAAGSPAWMCQTEGSEPGGFQCEAGQASQGTDHSRLDMR